MSFKNIDLTFNEGEIVGLYGDIGAGHFDLARALFGMYVVDEGTIAVEGRTLRRGFNSADSYRVWHRLCDGIAPEESVSAGRHLQKHHPASPRTRSPGQGPPWRRS